MSDYKKKIWATRFHKKDGTSFLNNVSGGEVILYTRKVATDIATEKNLVPEEDRFYEYVSVEKGWEGMRQACSMEAVIMALIPYAKIHADCGDETASEIVSRTNDFLANLGWGQNLVD